MSVCLTRSTHQTWGFFFKVIEFEKGKHLSFATHSYFQGIPSIFPTSRMPQSDLRCFRTLHQNTKLKIQVSGPSSVPSHKLNLIRSFYFLFGKMSFSFRRFKRRLLIQSSPTQMWSKVNIGTFLPWQKLLKCRRLR